MEERAVPAAGVSIIPTNASDTLRNSNDFQQTENSATYIKSKETRLDDQPGKSIRIKFQLVRWGGAVDTVFGRIYRNGVALGTERSTTSTQTYSEDFDCSAWVATDLIQIYVKRPTNPASLVASSNLRFYYDVIYDTTNQDP